MKELTRIIRRKRREFSIHQNGKTRNDLSFRLKFLSIPTQEKLTSTSYVDRWFYNWLSLWPPTSGSQIRDKKVGNFSDLVRLLPFQGDCRTSRFPRALLWADISLALQAAFYPTCNLRNLNSQLKKGGKVQLHCFSSLINLIIRRKSVILQTDNKLLTT